jgi:hypothetical protein
MGDAAWRVSFEFDDRAQAERAFAHLDSQTVGVGLSVGLSDPARLDVSGTLAERVERIVVEIDAQLKSLGLKPCRVVVDEWLPEQMQWLYHRKPGWRDSGGDWLSAIT